MTMREAELRLRCANPRFELTRSADGGFRRSRWIGEQPIGLVEAKDGLEQARLSLIGKPGSERVVAVTHQREYGDGSEPPVETLLAQLHNRYGRPTDRTELYNGIEFEVPRAPGGELIGPDNSLFRSCTGLRASSDTIDVRDDCGLSINFAVWNKQDNPALASKMAVSIVDQRATLLALADYEAAAEQQMSDAAGRQRDDLAAHAERAGRAIEGHDDLMRTGNALDGLSVGRR